MTLLLDRNADLNSVDTNGCTALWLACSHGHTDAGRLCLERGADPERATNTGVTPLYTSCSKGFVVLATLLLDRGADVDGDAGIGITPLYIACCYGYIDVARLCLDRGANIELGRREAAGRLCTWRAGAITSRRRGCALIAALWSMCQTSSVGRRSTPHASKATPER